MHRFVPVVRFAVVVAALGAEYLDLKAFAADGASAVSIKSPDGRNSIALLAAENGEAVRYSVTRDGDPVIDPSPVGPVLVGAGALGEGAQFVEVKRGSVDETFALPWGKTTKVRNRCSTAHVVLETPKGVRWELDLQAYDDGVAFRYRLPAQDGLGDFVIEDEATQFRVAGAATALFSGYDNFTSSHEALFQRKPVAEIPVEKLLEMPLLLTWPDGHAVAITEARVRHFAGMYLQRASAENPTLRARLSPLPSRPEACVVGRTPHESPWRVVLLADRAGSLLESNLLLCLNDPPPSELGDFAWATPGKTTFHWWNGAFEELYKQQPQPGLELARHKAYIDFCAKHHIAYHAVTGDGRPWYVQQEPGYAPPLPDADILTPQPDLELPQIIEYARQRGVRIRVWLHWASLQGDKLEQAFTKYESWGISGLMVDFLDRDDQQMIDFSEEVLRSAARHHLHIQFHGSPKFSGEQRTFPNLFNREGVLNLEYLKWSDQCTPAHTVNAAYTRALAGPVDYHLGGFHSVSRAQFKPRMLAPVVLGTRCHHLALYVVFENPMPMVADEPSAYEGQPGFDFLAEVPTTWDETRFLAGEPGEYVVLGRRKGDAWYLAGITNWTARQVSVPLECLGAGRFAAKLYSDGSMDEERPNEVAVQTRRVDSTAPLEISLAPGGGFVAVIRPE